MSSKFVVLFFTVAFAAFANGKALFEGDIELDASTLDIMSGPKNAYDAIKNKQWTHARVPYAFASNFDDKRKQVAREAIAEFHKFTCVKFVPRYTETKYIKFTVGWGCHSRIGMNREDKFQEVSIGHNCDRKGTVIHELMHALGFFHEQSRLDRNNYVYIDWSRINPGKAYNFNKYTHGQADYLGEPYDYDSIMHYGSDAFSTDGKDTIIPYKQNAKIGQRKGFSQIDVNQINKMYKCPARILPPTPKPACINKLKDCESWAKIGYCTLKVYGTYITDNCVKACNLC